MIIIQESNYDINNELETTGKIEEDNFLIEFKFRNGDVQVFEYSDERATFSLESTINWAYFVSTSDGIKTLDDIYNAIVSDLEDEGDFLAEMGMKREVESPFLSGRV